MILPKCPCGSGKNYEDCCFKIIDKNGDRKFHNGMSLFDGNEWHPVPFTRLLAKIELKEIDEIEKWAENIISQSPINPDKKFILIEKLAIFEKAFRLLLGDITKRKVSNIISTTNSLEVKKLWGEYLFSGRILLDSIGLYSGQAIGLDEKIKGISPKSIDHFIKILKKDSKNKNKIIAKQIEGLKTDIVYFIQLRDAEKLNHSTILSFPQITPEGQIMGGAIGGILNGKKLDCRVFSYFLYYSHDFIIKMTKMLLGTN